MIIVLLIAFIPISIFIYESGNINGWQDGFNSASKLYKEEIFKEKRD